MYLYVPDTPRVCNSMNRKKFSYQTDARRDKQGIKGDGVEHIAATMLSSVKLQCDKADHTVHPVFPMNR